MLMLVLSTVGFNFQVVLPLLAERSFAGQVSSYSLMMVAMGIGSIARRPHASGPRSGSAGS